MSRPWQVATIGIFALVLVGLGTTDALLTRGSILLPQVPSSSGSGTIRADGPEVTAILQRFSVTTISSSKQSLLERIAAGNTPVESVILMRGNDRIALFSWMKTPEVKNYFAAVKEALHNSFSTDLQDLKDETQSPEGRPVRNILTFRDPAIDEEKILFLRVRERLFEFHMAEGKETDVLAIVDALSE